MTVNSIIDGTRVTMEISGRVDTVTAPDFEKELDKILDKAEELILDMKELEYTSSAGLRMILKAQKQMSKKGGMKLINVNDEIMDVFDITGFLDILTIE